MSSRGWVFRIEDILKAIDKIEKYVTKQVLNKLR